MSINSSTTSTSRRSEMGHVLDAGFRYLNHIYTAQISQEPELDGFHDLLNSYNNDFKPVQFWLSAQLRCIYNLINGSQYPEILIVILSIYYHLRELEKKYLQDIFLGLHCPTDPKYLVTSKNSDSETLSTKADSFQNCFCTRNLKCMSTKCLIRHRICILNSR